MLCSDNPINPDAWYFRAADRVAPVLVIAGALVAVAALVQLIKTF